MNLPEEYATWKARWGGTVMEDLPAQFETLLGLLRSDLDEEELVEAAFD